MHKLRLAGCRCTMGFAPRFAPAVPPKYSRADSLLGFGGATLCALASVQEGAVLPARGTPMQQHEEVEELLSVIAAQGLPLDPAAIRQFSESDPIINLTPRDYG